MTDITKEEKIPKMNFWDNKDEIMEFLNSKPCPYCGGEKWASFRRDTGYGSKFMASDIFCNKCSFEVSLYSLRGIKTFEEYWNLFEAYADRRYRSVVSKLREAASDFRKLKGLALIYQKHHKEISFLLISDSWREKSLRAILREHVDELLEIYKSEELNYEFDDKNALSIVLDSLCEIYPCDECPIAVERRNMEGIRRWRFEWSHPSCIEEVLKKIRDHFRGYSNT